MSPLPFPSDLILAQDLLCQDRLWRRRHGSVTSPFTTCYFSRRKSQIYRLLSVLLIRSSLGVVGSKGQCSLESVTPVS